MGFTKEEKEVADTGTGKQVSIGSKIHLERPLRFSLDKFKPEYKICEGGFSNVWKCQFEGKAVALKEIIKSKSRPECVADERKFLVDLKHPRIVELNGFFFEESPFFVMEFCKGSLADYDRNEIGRRNMIRFMYQLFEGLAWMHSKDIIHRDIKPDNLLISSKNNAKIGDLGSAYQLKTGKDIWTGSKAFGTSDYLDALANTQYLFRKHTDVFGMAASFFEISTDLAFLRPEVEGLIKDPKLRGKFMAEAYQMGRIKEKWNGVKGEWEPVMRNGSYVREDIDHRMKRCEFWKVLLPAVGSDYLIPTAHDMLKKARCFSNDDDDNLESYWKNWLQEEGLDASRIDDDNFRPMKELVATNQDKEDVKFFPKPVKKYTRILSAPCEWSKVLSECYYDDKCKELRKKSVNRDELGCSRTQPIQGYPKLGLKKCTTSRETRSTIAENSKKEKVDIKVITLDSDDEQERLGENVSRKGQGVVDPDVDLLVVVRGTKKTETKKVEKVGVRCGEMKAKKEAVKENAEKKAKKRSLELDENELDGKKAKKEKDAEREESNKMLHCRMPNCEVKKKTVKGLAIHVRRRHKNFSCDKCGWFGTNNKEKFSKHGKKCSAS